MKIYVANIMNTWPTYLAIHIPSCGTQGLGQQVVAYGGIIMY